MELIGSLAVEILIWELRLRAPCSDKPISHAIVGDMPRYPHDRSCSCFKSPMIVPYYAMISKRKCHIKLITGLLVGGLEHLSFFHILGIMIPTDFHIFSEGVETTNQITYLILIYRLYS